MTEQPPERLEGEDESYFRVDDFTTAAKTAAAREALDEYSPSVTEISEAAVAKLAADATEHRFRQHTPADECCLDDHDDSWWCPFGSGSLEGLYVSFEPRELDDAVNEDARIRTEGSTP